MVTATEKNETGKVNTPKVILEHKPFSWFKFKPDLNVRHRTGMEMFGVKVKDGYDVPEMAMDIRDEGRIREPLTALADGTIIKGNRRYLGAQQNINDPSTPQEVIANLQKIPVFVYPANLTPQEVQDIVLDHNRKSLSKAELLTTAWNMYAAGYKEGDIIVKLGRLWADFTGNARKWNTLPTTPVERDRELKSWLRGTVGWLLYAYDLGEYMRQQTLLQMIVDDGATDVKPEFKVTRQRVLDLNKIKNANGIAWHPANPTPDFLKKIEEFKAEDAGAAEGTKERPMTASALENRVTNTFSNIGRMAFEMARGKKLDNVDFESLDRTAYRTEQVFDVLLNNYDELPDGPIKLLVQAILFERPKNVANILKSHYETKSKK